MLLTAGLVVQTVVQTTFPIARVCMGRSMRNSSVLYHEPSSVTLKTIIMNRLGHIQKPSWALLLTVLMGFWISQVKQTHISLPVTIPMISSCLSLQRTLAKRERLSPG